MDVRQYVDDNAAEFFGALQQWLAIPSISADPSRQDDVRRSADWLAAHLRETGFPVAEVWETGTPGAPGLPAVFAHWPAADPAAPVVLVYGHHDVQPVIVISDTTMWSADVPSMCVGSVTRPLPGFYDRVLPLSQAERELIARLPVDEKAWLAEAGNSGATAGEALLLKGAQAAAYLWDELAAVGAELTAAR